MSGPFGSSQWMYSSGGFYGFPIEQSLRFNDNDSAYLSRTPASAGNLQAWTWSGWVKRGNLGGRQSVFTTSNSGGNDYLGLEFQSNDTLLVGGNNGSASVQVSLTTSAVFRDTSAWYHIVLFFDTTQATASERVGIYINGKRITSFSSATYPPQNYNGRVNTTNSHNIGSFLPAAGLYLDGYLAEVNFIDGTALDPTSFGEFKSGVWIPKQYGGTYGTNGYRLSFADSSNIGDDTSGNTNDWTANSLVATDVLLDSPTNNFAVLNPIGGGISETLSEGNLSVTTPNAGNTTATIGVTSGKWYWEGRLRNDNYYSIGITNEAGVAYSQTMSQPASNSVGYWSGGGIYDQGGLVATVASYTTSDVVAAALDMDAGNIKFYKNNTLIYTYTFGSSGAGVTIPVGFPAVNSGGISGRATDLNFGQDSSFAGNKTAQGNTDANGIGDFYYAPPSGYLALCTANLPDPVIDPAQDDVPSDYFNTVLYTGTGAAQSITGVGFQPDLVWTKNRSIVASHGLNDAVRGAGEFLYSNGTSAEQSYPTDFVSFDADGFSLGSGSGSVTNGSGNALVAWNWLAGNGTSSNTDGSITSTVSVNQKAGFSIVGYDSNPSGTVGHGLGVTPKVIIEKKRDAASDWIFGHTIVDGSYDYMRFNTTAANANAAVSAPTSTVFTPNATSDSMIAYCFAEVEGYSKFGSYTGNGSTDGPFVFCNFRPALVCVKRTSDVGSWTLLDAERSPYNDVDDFLYANSSNAELANTTADVDFLSNGFKIRNTTTDQNASGSTYIFMAFAENPFKYANAR